MLFNSIDFAIFLPTVFLLYWFVFNKKIGHQNFLIVVTSYLFYGWWDWRFLALVLFSTIVDFFIGLGLSKQKNIRKRKALLWVSIFVNLGFLGFFKYYNFFLENFIAAFRFLGHPINPQGLNIILPVGISFYTFQTLSYTIDVYKRKLEPTKDFIAFSAFVSFFPQLVAGPIERATHLLPQFYTSRIFKYKSISYGLKLMLWGLFMKVAVADRLSLYIDNVYSNVDHHSGISLIVATCFFAIQIYCDFGGYSLIAIGTAKMFGFNLMQNFRRPYLSSSFKEFWSRWHISLSSWFRDYLYIPLGGNKKGELITKRNLLITFVVSGFWHGANWTFIIWGALHGLYLIIEKYLKRFHINKAIGILIIFILTNFAWIFFRSPSVSVSFEIITRIFTHFSGGFYVGDIGVFAFSIFSIIILFTNDYISEYYPNYKLFTNNNVIIRYSAIVFIIVYIIAFGVFDNSQFIYFQF